MKIVAKTDVGRKRRANQDSYASGELSGGTAWAVVCDGMGGAYGGDIASMTSVRIISEKIISVYDNCMSEDSIRDMLVDAINTANSHIFDMSCSNQMFEGMGTTVVAMIMDEKNVYIAHAGDSRAYLLSAGVIKQITKDHSVVQEMVESGEISPEQAVSHPNKNLITRAIGVDDRILVDFVSERIGENDAVLICTDGLTNFVSDSEILDTASGTVFYEIAEKLVNTANVHGGGDNITVVLVSA